MAIAQGQCPSCGAPIAFSVGSSMAKVCDFCRATVYRSDRGLQDLGKVAELANTPSLIAVGDQGTLGGRPFEVLGRVQLDHGAGPWDEYYVAFDHGRSWGWLAYAEGQWFVTERQDAPAHVPPYAALRLEGDVDLGRLGVFRVVELKVGRVVSAEGELPEVSPPGTTRHYADLHGAQNAFATIDYGDETGKRAVFAGRWFAEREMRVTQLGPRTQQKVKLAQIRCPNCGGDVPKRSGERAERLGCPYCGAISDLTSQEVIALQEAAYKQPDIPIGSHGVLDSIAYACIAYVRRSSNFDGERFSWDEYLLFSEGLGFRWLVKDESSWMWVMPISVAELDLRAMPARVAFQGKTFNRRNRNVARVDYVLGELYWKCAVGEQTRASDYVHGSEVLSREESPGEVKWSYSAPVSWALLSGAFGLPREGPGGQFAPAHTAYESSSHGSVGRGGSMASVLRLVLLVAFLFIILGSMRDCGGGVVAVPVFGGSGYYGGGK